MLSVVAFALLLHPHPLAAQNLIDPTETQTIKAGVPRHFEPHYIIDADGNVSGFAIDVMNEVAKRANLHVEYTVFDNWKELTKALAAGDIDIIPNMGFSDERLFLGIYSIPYETMPIGLFTRANDKSTFDLNSLKGKTIGTASTNLAETILTHKPSVQTRSFDNLASMLSALLKGEIDALAYPEQVVWYATKKLGIDHNIETKSAPLALVERGMLLHKKHTALRDRIETHLKDFTQSAEFDVIHRDWFGSSPRAPKSEWFMISFIGSVSLLTIMGLITWMVVRRFHKNRYYTEQYLLENDLWRRVVLSAVVMMGGVVIIVCLITYFLYETALDQNRDLIAEQAQSKAELMSSVAEEMLNTNGELHHSRLGLISNMLRGLESSETTSELTIAEQKGDTFVFLLRQKASQPYAPRRLPMGGSLAIPMQNAVSGLSGTMIGMDYRGEPVMAAYRPISALKIGIVIKRDLAEIRAPFIQAGWSLIVFSVAITLIGGLAYMRLTAPVISFILARNAQFHSLFNDMSNAVLVCINEDGTGDDFTIVDANPSASTIEGKARIDLIGRKVCETIPDIRQSGVFEHLHQTWKTSKSQVFGPTSHNDKDGTFWRTWRSYQLPTGQLVLEYTDVTETINATEALRVSQERLEFAMRGANDGLWDWDLTTNKVHYSIRWKNMLGYEDNELPNESREWEAHVHPDDLDHANKQIEAFIHQDSPTPIMQVEFRMRHKTGKWIHILSRAYGIFDSAGQCVRMIGTHTDISDLKHAETALRQEKEQFEKYLQVVGNMLVVIDANGLINLVNRATCTILGYDEEELIGENWFETCIPKDRVQEMVDLHQSILNENSLMDYFENEVLTKTGEHRIVRWHTATVHDEAGKPFQVLRSGEDITDIRNAERKLRESQTWFQDLIENLSDWIWEIDTEGNYSYASPQVRDVLGYEPDEILGKSRFDFMPSQAAKTARAYYDSLATSHETLKASESAMTHKSGRKVMVETNGTPMFDEYGIYKGYRGVDRDITERKKSEAALRKESQSRAELDSIVNQSPAVAFAWDNTDGWPVTYVSANVRQFGYTQEDFLSGKISYAAIVHPEDIGWLNQEVNEHVLKGQQKLNLTYRIVTSWGEPRWVDVRIFDDMGDGRKGKGVVLDITDRVSAELRAQQYLQTAASMFLALDKHARIMMVNQKTCEVTGQSQDALIGTNWIDRFVPPESRVSTTAYFEQVMSGETASKGEYESDILTASGERRTIHWYHSVLFKLDDSVGNIIAFGVDVTEQRNAEIRVQEYARFPHENPNPVLRIDRHGDVLLANMAAQRFLTNMAEIADEDTFEDVQNRWAKMMAHALSSLEQEQHELQCGDKTYVFEIVPGNHGSHINLYGTDITALKAAERKLQMSAKMEAVGHLTGGVAHDFNNLLTVILGNLQLLERQLHGNEKAETRINKITAAAHSGAELTRRLLSFSRQQILEHTRVDINELVTSMFTLINRTMGEDIEIKTVLCDKDCIVTTDANSLENALLNLAINARDAMPNGGTLTIETTRRHLDREQASTRKDIAPGEYIEISVSDTGIGMTRDVSENIFEPFYTTKDIGKGTGLGLSTVYGFMKQAGGHISVYSELGHGTLFKLYLPTEGEKDTPRIDQDGIFDVHINVPPAKILVVEDAPEVREVAVTILQEAGHTIVEAENGDEGLRLFKENRDFDMIFSDIIMPGTLRGPDMAKAIHEIDASVPVLFASGYAEQMLKDKAQISGKDLLQKPYTSTELLKRINAILTSKS